MKARQSKPRLYASRGALAGGVIGLMLYIIANAWKSEDAWSVLAIAVGFTFVFGYVFGLFAGLLLSLSSSANRNTGELDPDRSALSSRSRIIFTVLAGVASCLVPGYRLFNPNIPASQHGVLIGQFIGSLIGTAAMIFFVVRKARRQEMLVSSSGGHPENEGHGAPIDQ